MTRAVVKMLLRLLPVLLLVTIGTSLLVELLPGDPAVAILGANASPESYAKVREQLGLNEPVHSRYLSWLSDLAQGDLGQTLVPPVQDVSDVIMARMPVTLELTVLATLLAVGLSVPIGLWSAYRLHQPFDRIATVGSYAVISLPSFLLGLLLIFIGVLHPEVLRVCAGGVVAFAAVRLGIWFAKSRNPEVPTPSTTGVLTASAACTLGVALVLFWPDLPRQGFVRISDGSVAENLRSLVLPVLTLAMVETAQLSQLLRNDAAATLREDFVLAARAKGMPLRHILLSEVLRPSSFSLVTVAGISFGRMLGGAVIVETLFRLPGMGTLIVNSVATKDFVVLQTSVLVLAVLYVLVNTMVDLSYLYLDPRVRRASR